MLTALSVVWSLAPADSWIEAKGLYYPGEIPFRGFSIGLESTVWAVLIIAQILQALRVESAGRAGVDPFEVSMALLVTLVLAMQIASGDMEKHLLAEPSTLPGIIGALLAQRFAPFDAACTSSVSPKSAFHSSCTLNV